MLDAAKMGRQGTFDARRGFGVPLSEQMGTPLTDPSRACNVSYPHEDRQKA